MRQPAKLTHTGLIPVKDSFITAHSWRWVTQMAMTAAQYKTKFETALADSKSKAFLYPQRGVGYAQIGSVWAFLYAEKSRMDKLGITPSAAADAYAVKAEAALGDAAGRVATYPNVCVANCQEASVWAFAFGEQAKMDAA